MCLSVLKSIVHAKKVNIMKRLTLKEMTQAQRQRLNSRLAQAEKEHGRSLTSGESNRIKSDVIDEIMKELEKELKKSQTKRKKSEPAPSDETYVWSANHPRWKRN
jgi:hypothetical protein